jgi:DNA-binding beta-propeller fold protein YncE
MVRVGGNPFGVMAALDGRWVFIDSPSTGVEMLRTGSGPGLTLVRTIPMGPVFGMTLADGGRYLLAAANTGAVVINVARAEQGGAGAVLGRLAGPSGQGAIEVAVSRDGRFAFVSLEYSARVAVFDLQRALTHGFGPADYVGAIRVGLAPVGLAVSPDGRWLYATSELSATARLPSQPAAQQASPGRSARAAAAPGPDVPGTLTVISVQRAETDPARSVVATADAGCQPVRVITSADGRVVWVTARASDALLGFSAALLRSDPARSLVARVRVGEAPVGLALVDRGSRIVVADSNRFLAPGTTSSLAVVNVGAALAGRPALAGLLPAGRFPREMAPEPGGRTLLVTNFASGQVELVNVADLP